MVEPCAKSVTKEMEIRTIKEQVLHCLTNYPGTRNSDTLLRQELLREFYPEKILVLSGGREAITFENEYLVPTQETVKRIRAKIQNVEGRLLPTSEAVVKQRRINEDRWRDAMGYALEEPLSGAIQQTLQ